MRAVVVGSGPNGLAAALTLAKAGIEVQVLEAADVPGGGTRSSELTLPGLIHDECSGFHPFAVDSSFARFAGLDAYGLTWRWPTVQYAHPLEDGSGAIGLRSLDDTVAQLGPDGRRWRAVFEPLVRHFAAISEDFSQPMLRIPAHPVALGRFGARSVLPASLLARFLSTPRAQALFGGVAAHAMTDLTGPLSSAVGVALACAAHAFGWPVAEGGSASISRAMIAALRDHDGAITTGFEVRSIADIGTADIVMLDVAPGAAVRILGDRLPGRVRRALTRYRHGPAVFKIDYAIDGDVPWRYEPARLSGTVHLGGTYRDLATAERAVARGVMPERPFVLVGQQYLADPTRSRGGVNPLYVYAHVPAGYEGDATRAIEDQLERYAPGFRDRVLAKHVTTVAQLERHNPNFVGGDVITGRNSARQLVFRPRLARDPYALGIPGYYLCSAATPPGAGAHGMCGYNAARSALAGVR